MEYKIPLEEIIDCKDNIYQITTVAIKEAIALCKMDKDLYRKEYGNSKITAVALSKVLSGEVKYNQKSLEEMQERGRKRNRK